MMHQTRKNRDLLWLCILLTPLINLGLDIYTPSLPAIATAFHTTHTTINLTLLIYTATFGIVQPLIGPTCDRVGRQPFVWIALITYFLSSIGASLSPNIWFLCICRLGQGAGAAIIAAAIKAILVDRFHGKQLAKANSYFSLGWSLTPILAPAIGGYLQHYISWQASFYFMAAYCAICIIMTKRVLIETCDIKTVVKKNMLATWMLLLRDRVYTASALILTVQFSIIILYYLSAPYVLQIQLHLNPAQYGKIMLLLGCSYFIGNIVNQFLLTHYSLYAIILTGLILSVIASVTIILTANLLPLTIFSATAPISFLFFCDGLIFANVLTHALMRHKQYPATSGALIGGALNLIGSGITYLANHFLNLHHLAVLGGIYTVILLCALILFFITFKITTAADVN